VQESATILFTDLVGSTALSQSLAPQVADEVRRDHFDVLRKSIAQAGGSEVKNLGDGLMVSFSASSSALSCAIAMQQGVETQNRQNGRDLGVRIGISSGEVTREGKDYFGDPVVEAARLCARAEGGQILAAQIVQIMAGRRSPVALRPLGELQLQGIADPVSTLEVAWEPVQAEVEAPDGVPLPRRLARRPGPSVIGRRDQLTALAESLKRVSSGAGREVLLIGGEAGQGKTTLAAEASRRAHDAGAIVLLGRCDEDLGVPYAPFAESLSHYVSHAPQEVLEAHVAAQGADAVRVARTLGSRLGELPPLREVDGETERYLLYGAVTALLGSASQVAPVVLVLDDLQWADAASLQLLRHLVREGESLRLLVIGTYRDDELSASHPLAVTLSALRREPGVDRLTLKGLDDGEVVEYLEAAAGQTLSRSGVELAHAVYGETDGNPFFVSEMLRDLADSGTIFQDSAGRWTARDLHEVSLPNSVTEVVTARVARLGERAVGTLSMAAVIGRDFDLARLGTVLDRDEDELLDLMDSAVRVALVREVPDAPGHYMFAHALVQRTLYQQLGATRRARAHRRVAEALEQSGADVGGRAGELAHHWFHATQLVDAEKAISYSRRAGQEALAALAPEDAVRYFEQALDLHDHAPGSDPALGVRLRLELGMAQQQAGIADYRDTLLAAAQGAKEAGDSEGLVHAALANHRGLYSALGVVDEERVSVLEAALAAISADDSRERALLLATLCSELTYGPLDRRLELARQAADMAERLDDPATIVDVVSLQRQPLSTPELLQDRLLTSERAVALSRRLDDPARRFWSSCADRLNAVQGGEFERARERLAAMVALSDRLRQPTLQWVTAYHDTVEASLVGEPDRSEGLAAKALEIGSASGQPDAMAFYGAQLMLARYQQGRLGELGPLIEDVARQNPRVAAYQACLAASRLEEGRDDEALLLLEAASGSGFSNVHPDPAWLDALSMYGRVAIELGVREPAALLVTLLAPYRDQIPFQGLTVHEPLACHLGGLLALLDRHQDADASYARSLDLCLRGGMRFAEAQTRLGWGRLLARSADTEARRRGLAMLAEARTIAAEGGYRSIERRVEQALA